MENKSRTASIESIEHRRLAEARETGGLEKMGDLT